MFDPGRVVWLTGPPASGKSTIANFVANRLQGVVLDSDELRSLLTPNPTYSDEERDHFYAQLAGIAKILWRSGATVLIAATAPRRRYRDALRGVVDPFLEVYVTADDQVLEARDPKGLYKAAREGRIEQLPGRGSPYEVPLAPDLRFDTDRTSLEEIATSIQDALARDDVQTEPGQINPHQVESYLRRRGYPRAKLVALTPLGMEVQEGLKAHGYGRPLRVTFDDNGARRDVTLRTMGPDAFGHDRRADRFDGLVLAYDEFDRYERHIKPLDVGVIDPGGALRSIGTGEPFLLTSYVDGELYARDLHRLARAEELTDADSNRAVALAEYLASMHSEPMPVERRRRAIRDLLGHGEGIFGLVDGFDADDPVATPARLKKIEHDALDWMWRLRDRDDRSRRTHGDFHPFNILFADGVDFTVLDSSRGGVGDAADDVTALTINFPFFALTETGSFEGPLRRVWDVFWEVYLVRSGDADVLSVVAPYFAWRTLVLVCPAWYPDIAPEIRDRLLRFAERLLAGAPFTPAGVAGLLS